MPPKPSIPTGTTTTGSRPAPPTHFLCIPLVTLVSRPQLAASISSFKDDVCSPASFAIPEDAIRPVGTLHLTLGVMSFPNRNNNQEESSGSVNGLGKAKEILRGLKLREIWRAACKEAAERTRPGVPVVEEEGADDKIKITLKGLASMQPPNRAAVLYAPPVDTQGKLYGFCEKVRDVFRDGGVMDDDGGRPLLLHATVVNTIYVKGDKGSSHKSRRGGRGGRGGGKERLTVDATGIIDRYEDQVWMEGVELEGVAICKMGAKKVLNENGDETGDEKYEVVEEMSPPEKRRPVASSSSSPATASSSGSSSSSPTQRRQRQPPRSSSLVATSRNRSDNIISPPRASISRGSSPTPTLRPTSPSPAASAAAIAAASALRQKDARILALERELGIMENEFTRELDQETITITHLQAKCAALEKRLAEQEVVARGEILRRDEEIKELRSQMRGLKEWVSNSTRTDGQVQISDEVFGEGMARLGNGLQNWVLVNFRRSKVDLTNVPEPIIEELARLVPMYEDLVSTSKIHLLQSVVSRLLVEHVFNTHFPGLSKEESRQLTETETLLASYGASDEPINQWRSTTLTILRKDGNKRLQTETANLTNTIVSRVNELLDAMTATKPNEGRDQGLRALVTSAIDLSRLLSVQRAVFNATMPEILPHQRIVFDAETMEDIGGEDEENLFEREVCCVTFPGIIKRGDVSGGQLQYRNVISKARVLCSPE
ncbi:AKAP7 2'5' RNA ligase-like domain-containing protein [Podospora fimiseda]|uniref:AKAP7 2'5' RNA ligase-like domain-containing protein n=1 Tax=Podospora fimiseda TaxID=252190 RepID=A0AAN7BEU6_9PEZI|nr:AKAP7 2'5' RNA ligase-like domain-containing protein [Podospora fimiseda]